jgi:hypothetical protein
VLHGDAGEALEIFAADIAQAAAIGRRKLVSMTMWLKSATGS